MAKVTDRLAKYSWITTPVLTVHRRVLFTHYLVDERHELGDPVASGSRYSAFDAVRAGVDVHRVTPQERHQGEPGLAGQVDRK